MAKLLSDPRFKMAVIVAGGLAAIGIGLYLLFFAKPSECETFRTQYGLATTQEEKTKVLVTAKEAPFVCPWAIAEYNRILDASTQRMIDESANIAKASKSGNLSTMTCAELENFYYANAAADPTYLRGVVNAGRSKGCEWATKLPKGGTV